MVNNPGWIAELETYPQFEILNKLVQTDSTYTVAEALQEFDKLTSAAISGSDSGPIKSIHDHAWHTWSALFDALVPRTTPAQQSKLVEFIVQLQQKTISDPATGERMRYEGYGPESQVEYWKHLPMLGMEIAERDMAGGFNDESMGKDRSWENASAFLAQLTAASKNCNPREVLDQSSWALANFLNAFEDADSGDDWPIHGTKVRMACWWFIYAADVLWEHVLEHPGIIEAGKVDDRFNGGERRTLFSLTRWQRWEEGLLVAQTIYEDEETKELIKEALAHIERVVADPTLHCVSSNPTLSVSVSESSGLIDPSV